MLSSRIKRGVFELLTKVARRLPVWRSAGVVDRVAAMDWLRVQLPENAFELHPDFISQFVRAKEIPMRRIFRLQNVCVMSHGVVFKNLRVFIPSLPWVNDLDEYRRGDLLIAQWQNPRVISGPVILIYDQWAMNNYYHWMIESLPRLYLAQQRFSACAILLPESTHEFVQTSLQLFGIQKIERIRDEEVIKVKELILPEIVYYNGVEDQDNSPESWVNKPPQFNQELILLVRKKLFENLPIVRSPFRKIYVSRSRSKIRRLINEDAIIPILREFGYDIVYFEGMSLMQQIMLMQETKILLGVHGANMVNILFLPPSATAVEIMNDRQVNDAYYLLSSTLGIRYFSIPAKMENDDLRYSKNSVEINDADLVVNVDYLREILNRAHLEVLV